MSTTAVIVLSAIARDEFERDWHGFEEPFSFIDGDFDEQHPISHFTTTIGGTTYSLKAQDVAQVVIHQLQDFREEIETEENEEEWPDDGSWVAHYLTDEEKDEKAREHLWKYWSDQLEGEDEWLLVMTTRLDYLVEGFKAMAADFAMIRERIPDLKPELTKKLQGAYVALIEMLENWER